MFCDATWFSAKFKNKLKEVCSILFNSRDGNIYIGRCGFDGKPIYEYDKNTKFLGVHILNNVNCFGEKILDLSLYLSQFHKDIKVFKSEYGYYISSDKGLSPTIIDKIGNKILGILPRFFPEIFENQPLTQDERDFLKAVSDDDKAKYIDFIFNFYKLSQEKIRQQRINNLTLNNKNFNSARISAINSHINRLYRQIKEFEMQIRDANQKIADENALVIALENQDDSEVIDYMKSNKCIYPAETDETDRCDDMLFFVGSTLEYFDVDLFERMKNNPLTYISSYKEQEIKLLENIFSDNPRFKVKIKGKYGINFSSMNAFVPSSVEEDEFLNNYIPNSHIYIHNCLGSHGEYIRECLNNGDFISAIEQCCSSAKSLNLGESVSAMPFIEDIFDEYFESLCLIDTTNNSHLSPKKAIQIITENETKN